jgi:formylglycine-generating enzyme required for sulfatase activity
MKKLAFLLVLMLVLGVANAVPKQKIAVVVGGDSESGVKQVLCKEIVAAVLASERYNATDHTADFTEVFPTLLATDGQAAEVSVRQMSKLGAIVEADMVAVVNVRRILGALFVVTQLINVEHSSVIGSDSWHGEPKTEAELGVLAQQLVSYLMLCLPQMVLVEGGSYMMGCTDEQGQDCYRDEKPSHAVTVDSFYMSKHEVTQAMWHSIMGGVQPSKFQGDSLPVEQVSLRDVNEFLDRLNKRTGRRYRLPTEAEWEFAARGGIASKEYRFSGSNVVDDVAWYLGNSGNRTRAVGSRRPNELGIYDLCGNVWEWCSDSWAAYPSAEQQEPAVASGSKTYVVRGGAWNIGTRYMRVSYRNHESPDTRKENIGFRLVLPVK